MVVELFLLAAAVAAFSSLADAQPQPQVTRIAHDCTQQQRSVFICCTNQKTSFLSIHYFFCCCRQLPLYDENPMPAVPTYEGFINPIVAQLKDFQGVKPKQITQKVDRSRAVELQYSRGVRDNDEDVGYPTTMEVTVEYNGMEFDLHLVKNDNFFASGYVQLGYRISDTFSCCFCS